MIFDISFVWILVAAIVYFAVGALWYSPPLFGNAWLKLLGRKKKDMNMPMSAMVLTFLAILLIVMVEAYFVHVTKTPNAWRGAYLGAKLWLGFVATTALINNAFQGARKKLYLIDQGYHLVGFVLAGAILAYFAS